MISFIWEIIKILSPLLTIGAIGMIIFGPNDPVHDEYLDHNLWDLDI